MEPHLRNHSIPIAPRQPREYCPTSQLDFEIFYHQIFCCPTKRTLLQVIKGESFSKWPVITEKLISKYIPESEITPKGYLEHQKQCTAAAEAANLTYLSTKVGENTSEVLLQRFDPTEKIYSDPTGQFPMQSDRGNNYSLVSQKYNAKQIIIATINNITGTCILSGITKIHIMDNEVSEDLRKYFEDSDIQFQLVPPHIHWWHQLELYI